MVVTASAFDPILDHCITALLEQRKPVEDCMLDYPEHKEVLEPLLRLAYYLQSAGSLQAPANFRMTGAIRVNNLIAGAPRRKTATRNRWQRWVWSGRELLERAVQRAPGRTGFSWVYGTVLLVLLLSLTGWRMVYAANQSLPGDTLYPVKLRVEGIRLLVAAAPVENARLQMAYTQERFTEMVSLAEKQRAAEFPDAVQGYTHQLSATMTTLADEQVFTQEDRADLSRQLVDDLTDNELRLTALLVALPVKYPMPSDFRAAVETALALIQGSCEQARHWSGLPPLLPQSPAVPNPAQATTPTGQILTPSPTSTLVPTQASQTPRPITSTQDPDEMFTEWPTEWPPLEETPVPNPQWTEVNMPWPTQIDLPTAWPTELPPLPTVIQDYWPTEFSTFLPPEDLPDPGTPFPWPPDPDDPPGWPSE